MQLSSEALERAAQSGEAVFATDGADRIILWNRECEALLGLPSRRVIGRTCFEVMCGRDANGNLYCHRNCAVAYQAREKTDMPVRPFPLTVRTGDGTTRRVSASMFAIPSYHPALTTVVHTLRPADAAPAPAQRREPLVPIESLEGAVVALTTRETEVLGLLAQGIPTSAIGRRLGIGSVTVRNHIQSVLQKLQVHSKLEAVVLAHKNGLIPS